MSAAARKALEKLLSRAERAWSRNSEDATLALRMSAASFKDYLELPTRRDTDEFHAAMRAAERAGAIRIEWDSRAGEDGQILRVVLMDRAALTNHLGRTPLWDACSQAAARLSEFAPHEGARRLLEKWQIGKRPRGIGPDRVDDLVDAVRVLHGLDEYSGEDIPVRQYSVKLFNDSKRIETLLPVLDFLTSEEDDEEMARTAEEILGGLGLIRHPQPALAAGIHRRQPFDRRADAAVALDDAQPPAALGHQEAPVGQEGHGPRVGQAAGDRGHLRLGGRRRAERAEQQRRQEQREPTYRKRRHRHDLATSRPGLRTPRRAPPADRPTGRQHHPGHLHHHQPACICARPSEHPRLAARSGRRDNPSLRQPVACRPRC